jgi:DNA-directed RNA polymerase specialized sigma24 family protein
LTLLSKGVEFARLSFFGRPHELFAWGRPVFTAQIIVFPAVKTPPLVRIELIERLRDTIEEHRHRVPDWNGIDFKRLEKVLFIKAVDVVRDASLSFDMGVSAEDLVKETLTAFLDSSNGLGWSEKQGLLETFLGGVLLNKARTHFRRAKKIAGSLDAENHGFPVVDGRPTPAAQLESREFQEKLYEAVGGDADLRDLIAAVDLTTGASNVNQQLAEALGKTPREVVNLKRRLLKNRRVLELLKIYGKGQAVKKGA